MQNVQNVQRNNGGFRRIETGSIVEVIIKILHDITCWSLTSRCYQFYPIDPMDYHQIHRDIFLFDASMCLPKFGTNPNSCNLSILIVPGNFLSIKLGWFVRQSRGENPKMQRLIKVDHHFPRNDGSHFLTNRLTPRISPKVHPAAAVDRSLLRVEL